MRLAHSLSIASLVLAIALPAAAGPRVLLCIDDGGDGSGKQLQASLEATKAFALVDLVDCGATTPTPQQLKTYDAVFASDSFLGFHDPSTLGDNLAGYVDIGGGVVEAMNGFDGFDMLTLTGKWAAGGYGCVLANGLFGIAFNSASLKQAPNEPNSPLVVGVGGITSSSRGDGTINKPKGAVSVWDFDDGIPGVCRMAINGHPRVDLNFSYTLGGAMDKNPGDAVALAKNALLFVSGGFNPLEGMPNPVGFPDTGTFAVSVAKTVTFTNTGMAGIAVTALTLTGQDPADFLIDKAPPLPLNVGVGGTFTVGVAFSPQVPGARSGALSATVQGQMFTADVALSGNAIPSTLAVTPNPLDMGGTQVNAALTKTLSIANKGMGKVTVSAISITAGGPVFAVSGQLGLPIQLSKGGNFPVTVTFDPTMNGVAMGALTVTSNDMNTPMVVVPLSGCAGPAGIAIDAASLAFGNVNLGAVSPDSVDITNSGCADLKVTDLALGGANPGDFILDKMNIPGSPIAAGASKGFVVSFKPLAVGNRSATVTITSPAGNKVVNVIGTGTTAMLKLSAMALAFGSVPVATPSMPKTLTLGNTGTGTLEVMAVTFSGAGAASFSSNAMPPLPLGPNANMPIAVTCTPANIGALTAAMTIATDVGNAVVNLTCTGVAPMIALTPSALDFGGVPLMATSMAQAVTQTNNGTADLHITDFRVAGTDLTDFNVTDPPMANATVKPKGTLTFHVTFSPTNHAMESAEVDIVSDDPKLMMMPAVVQLTGSGVQAEITVDSMAIDFLSVMVESTVKRSLTITNTGDVAVSVMSISVGGAFSVDNMGAMSLAPGKSYVVNVSFTPLTVGTLMGQLTITPAAPLQQIMVQLTGVGVGPMLSVTPPSLDFGPVAVGMPSAAQTVTLRNGGSAPIVIATVSASDPAFVVDTSATQLTLGANASTTFNVTFLPSSAMASSAEVNVTLKDHTKASASVAVTGSGVVKAKGAGGCKCDLGGGRSDAPVLPLLGLLAITALVRRRRRAA